MTPGRRRQVSMRGQNRDDPPVLIPTSEYSAAVTREKTRRLRAGAEGVANNLAPPTRFVPKRKCPSKPVTIKRVELCFTSNRTNTLPERTAYQARFPVSLNNCCSHASFPFSAAASAGAEPAERSFATSSGATVPRVSCGTSGGTSLSIGGCFR